MSEIKTFQDLRELIYDWKSDNREHCFDMMEEFTDFQRGVAVGEDHAYQMMLDLLRKAIKYWGVD